MSKRMNYKQLGRFYHSLGVLLNSGLTIDRALDDLKSDKKGPLLWMLDGLQHHVGRGGTLWEGMKQYRKYFDDFQVSIIRGAEESGTLVEILWKLNSYYERRNRDHRRFIFGMIYPLFLLHLAVLLPPLKYLLLESLDRSYWGVVLPPLAISYGVVLSVTWLWKRIRRNENIRAKIDSQLIYLPVIGRLIRDMALARVFWCLAMQLSAGIDAYTSAKNAAAAAGNAFLERQLTFSLYILESGRSFKDYFSVTCLLDNTQMSIISIGEQAGQIPDSLVKLVHQMELTNSERLQRLIKVSIFFAYFAAAAIIAMTVISFYATHYSI